jgi:hypothetical protein
VPLGAIVPFIGPAITAISAIGSAVKGSGNVQQAQTGPTDVGPLRDAMMQFLLHGGAAPGSAFQGLTVPGFTNGQPNPGLDAINKLFDATRATALGQAKEQAGNLTGSGYNNLFGSALATSLAQQQKQLADTGMQGALANQDTFARLMGMFGATGLGSQSYYKPSGFASLGQTAGPLGQLLDQFGRPRATTDSGTGNFNTDPQSYTGATFNGAPIS